MINPISMSTKILPCQPIKPNHSSLSFGKKDVETPESGDMFIFINNESDDSKFDYACLLASYYKNQYENLLKSKNGVEA